MTVSLKDTPGTGRRRGCISFRFFHLALVTPVSAAGDTRIVAASEPEPGRGEGNLGLPPGGGAPTAASGAWQDTTHPGLL